MGGPSEEHEVSLASGQNVINNLDQTKYLPIPIKIAKTPHQANPLTAKKGGGLGAGQAGRWFLNGKLTTMDKALKSCHIVFNALHGTFGEDGKFQAILEHAKVKYTGSGIAASALAMDKYHSREIFKLAGFNVPKTLKIKSGENYSAQLNFFINKLVKFPVVIKPASNGSSVGVSIVDDFSKLRKAIIEAFKVDSTILVEEFIKGREVTCGVLENWNNQTVRALPVTEIVPLKNNKFFNYKAKYQKGQSNEITPAPIDEDLFQKIQDIAVRAHQILGCSAYSRTDMILKNGNSTVYVLETNTLPGLSPASLLPKAASHAGLTFSQLLDSIITSSLG